MIYIFKGRQRQYKTTSAVGLILEAVSKHHYMTADIISVVHLFKPGNPGPWEDFRLQGLDKHDELTRELYDFCVKYQVRELEEYHYLNVKMMRNFMVKMLSRGLKRKIIFLDEIDRIFSHRFWHNVEQTEALLGLWQDEKLGNVIIGTCHLGKAIDSLLRESMQVEVISKTIKEGELVRLTVLNALTGRVIKKRLKNIKLIQRLFCSWEPIRG